MALAWRQWRQWRRRAHGAALALLRSPPAAAGSHGSLVDRRQPWPSQLYGRLVARKRSRESMQSQRIAARHVPVISVGNVTFGATGKTPCVLYVVDYALRLCRRESPEDGRTPLLLTRGYGDDEWRLLAQRFPSCELAVGADRVRQGSAKVRALGGSAAALSCIVLDDGLQQWRLQKDLELVMVDALHPWGNGLLLPCGSLREKPREALARADIVVVHHADLLASEQQTQALLATLQSLTAPRRKAIIATSRMKVVGLLSASETLADAAECELDDCVALVVCGVGNPESVRLVVTRLAHWAAVYVEAFPDHHAFSSGDVTDVLQLAQRLEQTQAGEEHAETTGAGARRRVVLLTTEKDAARSPQAMQALAQKTELHVLRCELELLHNARAVEDRLAACLNGGRRTHDRGGGGLDGLVYASSSSSHSASR